MKIHLGILVLLISISGYAQITSNPFDIIGKSAQKTTAADSSAANPFEIQGNEPNSDELESEPAELAVRTPPAQRIPGNPFEIDAEKFEEGLPDEPKYVTQPKVTEVPKDINVNQGEGFIFWVLLIILLLLAIILSLSRSIVTHVYKAATNNNFSNYLHRNMRADLRLIFNFLYIIFFVNAGLFLYLCMKKWGHATSGPNTVFLLSLFIAGIYLGRHAVMYFLAWLYPVKKELLQFNFSIQNFNVLLGLCLLPLNFILAYAPEAIGNMAVWVGLLLIIGLYLIRQLRAMLSSILTIQGNPMHFFLYLCTCEIAPIVILARLFQETNI